MRLNTFFHDTSTSVRVVRTYNSKAIARQPTSLTGIIVLQQPTSLASYAEGSTRIPDVNSWLAPACCMFRAEEKEEGTCCCRSGGSTKIKEKKNEGNFAES